MNRLTCPECGKEVKFRQELIGRKVQCPLCAALYRLERGRRKSPPTLTPLAKPAGASPPSPSTSPAKPRRGKKGPVVALAVVLTLVVGTVGAGGVYLWSLEQGVALGGGKYGYGYGDLIAFKDDVESHARPAPNALDTTFVDLHGRPLDLKAYRGKKNVVLVVMRGYTGAVCLYCTAQTSRLITQYPEFARRDAEVLVVYPGERQHLDLLLRRAAEETAGATVPFPVVLDENFHLVDRLGIRGDLAKPSTYILDKAGQIRFAYVGANLADRPSIKAMLQQLDALRS